MALDKRNRERGAKGDEALIKERMRKGLGGLRLRGEGGRTGYRPFAVKGMHQGGRGRVRGLVSAPRACGDGPRHGGREGAGSAYCKKGERVSGGENGCTAFVLYDQYMC